MVGDILLAGYTLTAEEWRALEPELRAELLGAAEGTIELHPRLEDADTADAEVLH